MSEHPPTADRPGGPAGSGHPEIDELASYVAGDLDVAGLAAVRAHLADCADCVADVAALRRADDELRRLAPPTMPADVAARLERAIEEARSGPSAAATVLPLQRKRNSAGWATGAAAAAVVALLGAVTIGALTKGNNDADKTAAGAPAAAVASRQSSADGAIYASGTDYNSELLATQVNTVLRRPAQDTAADFAAESAARPADAGAPSAPAAGATSAAATSAAAAAPAPAASETVAAATEASDNAAASSAPATALKSSESIQPLSTAPQDLSALRADPARLARCIQLITDGLATPVAIDFASYQGQPALAIIVPGPERGELDVYFAPGSCGASDDDTILYFGRVPSA